VHARITLARALAHHTHAPMKTYHSCTSHAVAKDAQHLCSHTSHALTRAIAQSGSLKSCNAQNHSDQFQQSDAGHLLNEHLGTREPAQACGATRFASPRAMLARPSLDTGSAPMYSPKKASVNGCDSTTPACAAPMGLR